MYAEKRLRYKDNDGYFGPRARRESPSERALPLLRKGYEHTDMLTLCLDPTIYIRDAVKC